MKQAQVKKVQQGEYIVADDIIAATDRTLSAVEKKMIKKACEYAKEQHEGQTRYSGLPYYTHTFEVGKLLSAMNMPINVVVAGILHDTIEDTGVTAKDIEREFNKDIAFFVDGVSHLGEVRYRGLDVRIKSLQKLFVATSRDIRVIIIKLMDRLHNMRTLESVPKHKQKRIAKETQRVYAPLADRLGMGRVRSELEDIAFKHLSPEAYESLEKDIKNFIGTVSMKSAEKQITKSLSSKGIATIAMESRIKSVYSTYMKMKDKKYSLNQVQDLVALRVIVDEVPTAYSALGILHTNWRPIPRTFKDYISFPKPNGYQALHTRILIDKNIFEVQILTPDMLQRARFGVAAHFLYKEKRHGNASIEMKWFDKLLGRNHKKSNAPWADYVSSLFEDDGSENTPFVKDIQSDFLQERMFIYTPKGEVVDLPKDATVADFAFAIHSDIGLHAEGALVNGKYVSIKQKLLNGDVVDVRMSKKPTITKKWLDWVKTAEARSRVRQFIKKNS